MELDFSSFKKQYNRFKRKYLEIMDITFKKLKIKADIYLSVAIVDNDYIHAINREYRKIDKETDVISFAFLDDKHDFSTLYKRKEKIILGEIYISYDKAKQQAIEYGHCFTDEMMFLFIHGLLHLLGFDHMTRNEEEIMFPLQKEILNFYKEKNNGQQRTSRKS